jgi:PleD family two-component response regulator
MEKMFGLFAAADERLFQAKREGRNRVVAGPQVESNGLD